MSELSANRRTLQPIQTKEREPTTWRMEIKYTVFQIQNLEYFGNYQVITKSNVIKNIVKTENTGNLEHTICICNSR